jgi:predicted transcriptional regulator
MEIALLTDCPVFMTIYDPDCRLITSYKSCTDFRTKYLGKVLSEENFTSEDVSNSGYLASKFYLPFSQYYKIMVDKESGSSRVNHILSKRVVRDFAAGGEITIKQGDEARQSVSEQLSLHEKCLRKQLNQTEYEFAIKNGFQLMPTAFA